MEKHNVNFLIFCHRVLTTNLDVKSSSIISARIKRIVRAKKPNGNFKCPQTARSINIPWNNFGSLRLLTERRKTVWTFSRFSCGLLLCLLSSTVHAKNWSSFDRADQIENDFREKFSPTTLDKRSARRSLVEKLSADETNKRKTRALFRTE